MPKKQVADDEKYHVAAEAGNGCTGGSDRGIQSRDKGTRPCGGGHIFLREIGAVVEGMAKDKPIEERDAEKGKDNGKP